MNFVTWSIRNPVPVVMMFIALVIGGIWAFPKLQIQDQPDISFHNVFVQVVYAGVPPSQMETEITRKVEELCRPSSASSTSTRPSAPARRTYPVRVRHRPAAGHG
jgi:multidrug efflux pump subunit AcrB